MRFQLVARTGHPDFLDLPWDESLEDWEHERLVELAFGLHRHVVRAVSYDDAVYVLKELPPRYADREYRFLRVLADEDVPVVEVVGVVGNRSDADGEPLPSVLITRHLEYSLPYRLLFHRQESRTLREPMLDALVDLLVRIHLVGFRWGDCSLSNTLFRRDADGLRAYLVDSETGELHDTLTDGQRWSDVEAGIERCAGELLDLQAAGLVRADLDVGELAQEVRDRYAALWAELTRDEVFGLGERHRIHERLQRINDLGYDVEELELVGEGDELRLHLSTRVVEPGRHRRRLQRLTGLVVQDRQARRLLNDIEAFRAWREQEEGRTHPDHVIAARWLDEVFEPTVAAVPTELRGKREAAQVFHEILDHWYLRSVADGASMDLPEAASSYVEHVLRHVPDERTTLADPDGDLEGDLSS